MVVFLFYRSVGITMQTSIFGKPLSEVIIQDVKIFCDKQVREGISLDYKSELTSKSLLKTMAAFANTRGGFIIVGVDDKDDKPKLPVEGIEWKESLPLSVTSMIVDNIYPYLSVDVHVCEPENGKTFVLVYVPESHEAPHWLFNRTELYVRRADRAGHTHWERFATDGEWDFLRNKRERSVSNPWYTRRRKKGGKAFKKVEQVDGQEKAVYARVQGQSGPGKLSTRYDDRSSAQEVWGLQLHDSSLAAGVSNQSALALR